MKFWVKLFGVVLALMIALLVALPFLVNANTFRPALQTQLTAVLGRTVTLGDLRLSILSGSLVARDLSIADDIQYSRSPFLQAKSLKIGVELRPLIFQRQLHIRSLNVEAPEIHLVRAANGTWNFSTIARNASPDSQTPGKNTDTTPGKTSGIAELTLQLFTIRNGRAVIEALPAPAMPVVYDDVNLTMQQFSLTQPFPFQLSATLPGAGSLTLTGSAGPINRKDAANTAFHADLHLRHYDPVAAELLTHVPNLSIIADVDAHASSNGDTVTTSGKLHTTKLQVLKNGPPLPMPIDLTYSIIHDLSDNSGKIDEVTLQAGGIVLRLNGTYQFVPGAPLLKLNMVGDKISLNTLQGFFPALGVSLPDSSVMSGGTLMMHLGVSGPPSDLVIHGPIEISNTTMLRFKLMKHLRIIEPVRGKVITLPVEVTSTDSHRFSLRSKLNDRVAKAFAHVGDVTNLEVLRLDLNATNKVVQVQNLYALLTGLGEATGSGSVSPAGALDFDLILKLSQLPNEVDGNLRSKLNALAGKAAAKSTANGIPLSITGTAADPVIIVDVKKTLQQNKPSIFGRGKEKSLESKNPITRIMGHSKRN